MSFAQEDPTGSGETDAGEAELFADTEGREADMFGSAGDAGDANNESPAPAEGGVESRLQSALEAVNDITDIGGQLYLRLDGTDAPLKYGVTTTQVDADGDGLSYSLVELGEDQPMSSGNLLDVYLDARPTDRLRAYARGRLHFDPTVRSDTRAFGRRPQRESVLLDQMWLKLDIRRRVYVTVGKQPIRWGSGRFWNPTDFMNRQKRDPLAVFDERTGVTLVKLHMPLESLGWNFYALASIDDLSHPEQTGVGGRAEFLVDDTEVAVSGAWRSQSSVQLGVDVSSALWIFDVHAELAVLYDVHAPFYGGDLIIDPQLGIAVPERQRSRADQGILQGVVGAEVEIRYTEEGDTIHLGVEYFYNDAGYKTARLYPFLATQGLLNPLFIGRHYIAAYALFAAPLHFDDTSIAVSILGNLSDESYLTRVDYSLRVLTKLTFNIYATVHFGDPYGSLRGRIDAINIDVSALQSAFIEDVLELTGVPDSVRDRNELAVVAGRGQPAASFAAGIGLRLQF